jgi:hypothetical protein
MNTLSKMKNGRYGGEKEEEKKESVVDVWRECQKVDGLTNTFKKIRKYSFNPTATRHSTAWHLSFHLLIV